MNPRVEGDFDSDIIKAEMGCGFVSIIDEKRRVYTWGDNYAS